MSSDVKPHLSHSQLDAYCRCPEAYRRRYVEGHRIPPGVSMIRGTALHGAAEVNMRQKLESGVDLSVSDIQDAAVAALDETIADGITLTDEEESTGLRIVTSQLRDDVADMALVHAEKQAPDYQPVLVEHRVTIELPSSPRDLVAVIDLADNKDRVTDFKTAKRAKSQDEADGSLQLTIYAAAFKAETGRDVALVQLDTVVQTKTKTYRDLKPSDRGPRDLSALAARIDAVNRAIDAGIFPPAAPGSWQCSPRYCGYARTCPYINPHRGAGTGD